MLDPKQRLIDFLCDMIAIDSCQPSGNESSLVSYIEKIMEGWAYKPDVKIIEHSKNRSSLILTFPARDGKTEGGYALAGHLDTVEVGNLEAWNSDPHMAIIKNDRIFGRGAADMKSGVATMLLLAEYFANNDKDVRKEALHFCFTADEERGGIGILATVEESRLFGLKGMLIPEPTDSKIATAEKGTLQIRVNALGKQAHASQPGSGINALDLLIQLYHQLEDLIEQHPADSFCGPATLTLSAMNGGAGVNIVPPMAEMDMDIRTIPSLDHKIILDFLKKQIDSICLRNPGAELKFKILNDRPAVNTDPDDPFVQRLIKVKTEQQELVCMPYYTDASQFVPKIKCPFVIYGPGPASQAHQANEFVEVEDLWAYYQALQQFYSELIFGDKACE